MIQVANHAAPRTSPVEAPGGRANALRRADVFNESARHPNHFVGSHQGRPISVVAAPGCAG